MEPASAIPLVIIGSARKDGNTREITDAVLQGIPAKKIDLANHTILPYSYDGQYADDDFLYVVDEMLRYQTIIFATPVYWYAMSGAMKIFLDRFTDLVTLQKEKGRKLKGRNFLLLVVGSDEDLPPGFEIPFSKTADYFDVQYGGGIYLITKEKYPDIHSEEAIIFRQKLQSGII